MKRTLMLLALLAAVLLTCAGCAGGGLTAEEVEAQMEAAAQAGNYAAIAELSEKHAETLGYSERKKLEAYYEARELETTPGGKAEAWFRYMTDLAGFRDAESRAAALRAQLGDKGYLFAEGYSNMVVNGSDYDYFLFGDTLMKVEAEYSRTVSRTVGSGYTAMITDQPLIVRHRGYYMLVAQDGTVLIDPVWSDMYRTGGDHFVGERADTKEQCVIDATGKVIATAPWGRIAYVSVDDRILTLKDGKKYGYATFDGRTISDAVWTEAMNFVDGYAAVKSDKWGIIDATGAVVVQPRFDALTLPVYGCAIATLKKDREVYTNVIDMHGNVVNPYPWKNTDPRFVDGVAVVQGADKKAYLINYRGDVLTDPGWSSISLSYHGAAVIKGRADFRDAYGLMSSSGQVILPPTYDKLGDIIEGIAVFRKEFDYGYIDCHGNVISPAQWDYADEFEGGFAVVQQDKKKGVIDATGIVVLHPGYEEVTYAAGSVFLTQLGGKWAAVDVLTGQGVPARYDQIAYIGEGLVSGLLVDSWGDKTWEVARIGTGAQVGGTGWTSVSNVFMGKALLEKGEQFFLLNTANGEVTALPAPQGHR